MSANEYQKKRDFPTDATRPRKHSTHKARKDWYARHRAERFARRQANA